MKKRNLIEEWERLKQDESTSQVFNFWSYPFLIDKVEKYRIIQYENKLRIYTQVTIIPFEEFN